MQDAIALTGRNESVLLGIVDESRQGLHPIPVVQDGGDNVNAHRFSRRFLAERFDFKPFFEAPKNRELRLPDTIEFYESQLDARERQVKSLNNLREDTFKLWDQARKQVARHEVNLLEHKDPLYAKVYRDYKPALGAAVACGVFMLSFLVGRSAFQDPPAPVSVPVAAQRVDAYEYNRLKMRVNQLEQVNRDLASKLDRVNRIEHVATDN